VGSGTTRPAQKLVRPEKCLEAVAHAQHPSPMQADQRKLGAVGETEESIHRTQQCAPDVVRWGPFEQAVS